MLSKSLVAQTYIDSQQQLLLHNVYRHFLCECLISFRGSNLAFRSRVSKLLLILIETSIDRMDLFSHNFFFHGFWWENCPNILTYGLDIFRRVIFARWSLTTTMTAKSNSLTFKSIDFDGIRWWCSKPTFLSDGKDQMELGRLLVIWIVAAFISNMVLLLPHVWQLWYYSSVNFISASWFLRTQTKDQTNEASFQSLSLRTYSPF